MKRFLLALLLVFPFLSEAQTDDLGILGLAPAMQVAPSVSQKGVQPPQLANSDLLMYCSNSNAGTVPPGPFSFYLSDLKTTYPLPTALPTMQYLYAGAWINNLWYGFMYGTASSSPPNVRNLVTVDTISGATTLIGATGLASTVIWEGLSMDPTTHITYAVASSGADTTSSLYTIDLSTGATTLIGTTPHGQVLLINLAISRSGVLYAVDILGDTLYTINKSTGACTSVGSIGFNASYAQSMHFDYATDILYYACLNVLVPSPLSYITELRTVDTTTGMTTSLGSFPAMSEVTALAIPYDFTSNVGNIAGNASATLSVWPNVTNNQSKVSFFIPKEGSVTLNVLDLCGKKVSSLVNETLATGNHEVMLSTQGLNAGIYFCSMNTVAGNQSCKVIITK